MPPKRAAVTATSSSSSSKKSKSSWLNDRYELFTLNEPTTISDFCAANGRPYSRGCGYYELVKTEDISASKTVIVVDDATGAVTSGDAAKAIVKSGKKTPTMFPHQTVYVQSTSANRGVSAGSRLIIQGQRRNAQAQSQSQALLPQATAAVAAVSTLTSVAPRAGLSNKLHILSVDEDQSISDFVSANELVFESGCGYYELTGSKAESVSAAKDVILVHRHKQSTIEGDEARNIIGHGAVKVKAASFPDYHVFIQSTSHNRGLKGNTQFLYRSKSVPDNDDGDAGAPTGDGDGKTEGIVHDSDPHRRRGDDDGDEDDDNDDDNDDDVDCTALTERSDRDAVARYMFRHVKNLAQYRVWEQEHLPRQASQIDAATNLRPDISAIVSALVEPNCKQFRYAYRPLTVKRTSAVTRSKFGGRPYLKQSEEWPLCTDPLNTNGRAYEEGRRTVVCGTRLIFFLQLRMNDLPTQVRGAYSDPQIPLEQQLFQVFWCSECNQNGRGLLRFIDSSAEAAKELSIADCQPEAEALENYLVTSTAEEEYEIVGWKRSLDYPNESDFASTGVRLPAGIPNYYFHSSDDKYSPLACDKLSGFPYWDNGAGPSKCQQSACDREMELVFQFGCNSLVGQEFGEGTPLHIMQCPVHKQYMTFDWDCD